MRPIFSRHPARSKTPEPTRTLGNCRPRARAFGKVAILLTVGGAAVVAGLIAMAGRFSSGGDNPGSGGTAVVHRGDLVITVAEGGSLRAKESVSIINEVEGSSTIAEIVPEGAHVEKGDVLVRMDSKELVEREATEKADLQTLDAEYQAALINLEIQKSEAESRIAQAEQAAKFAKMDLDKYLLGDFPQQEREAQQAIMIADQEKAQAEEDLEWTGKLLKKGVATGQQLKRDDLAFQRAKVKLEQETEKLRLLKEFEYPKQKAKLESDHTEALRELDRVRQQMTSNVSLKESALATAKSRLDIKKAAYDRLREQIDKTVIRSPLSGMIVYEKPPRWRSEETLEVGANIRYRQKLMTIPDLSAMEVDMEVNETEIERVRVGQPANITVEAFPDRKFTGKVQKIAVMAEGGWRGSPDVKVYKTVVSIEQVTDGLKPDMTAKAEILCNIIKDQQLIPVTGMRILRGRTAAIVDTSSGLEVREVEAGETNDKFIVIKNGLEEGDEVLLYTPSVMPTIPWTAPEKKPLEPLPPEKAGPQPPIAPEQPAAETPDRARIEQLRKQMETATPEEREKLREEMRKLFGNRAPGAERPQGGSRRGGSGRRNNPERAQ